MSPMNPSDIDPDDNPLLAIVPELDVLKAADAVSPRLLHDLLEQTCMGIEMVLEQAHKDDHHQHPDDHGGDHEMTSQASVHAEAALLTRYAHHPDVLARMLVSFLTDMALTATADELHEEESRRG